MDSREEITVLDLISMKAEKSNDLSIRCIAGQKGLNNTIVTHAINRPGLALCGYFDKFSYDRIQLFGEGEYDYLTKLYETKETESRMNKFFKKQIPCCMFSHNNVPPIDFVKKAEEYNCPVLISDLATYDITTLLYRDLSMLFAKQKVLHGVFMEIYGIGVLIQGKSGIGKSETALELIERGHRFIADDAVLMKCINDNTILGEPSGLKQLHHHMEIRGIGIVNIAYLFGVGMILDKKQLEMVIKLENWEEKDNFERIRSDATVSILDVPITYLRIPVSTGRNVPIIIETAAMNERIRRMGYDSNEKIMAW